LVSKEEFVEDLQRAFSRLARHGISPQNAPYFIPPYEWYNDHNASWARQLGLQIVNYTSGTYSNEDYTWPGIEQETGATYRSNQWLYDRMMSYEREHSLNGHIILIHFGTDPRRPEKFYHLLADIIDELRHRGYNFVSLPHLMEN
jgi:peptidoglycan/xylan/chitin deacetylase (PgdA/CDA1 family)